MMSSSCSLSTLAAPHPSAVLDPHRHFHPCSPMPQQLNGASLHLPPSHLLQGVGPLHLSAAYSYVNCRAFSSPGLLPAAPATKSRGSGAISTMAKSPGSVEMEKESKQQAGLPGIRRTVWDLQDQKPEYPKLTKDETADVVVVGAGIFGLSIAYNLVKAGKKVIVLEAKARGTGMTGRTTAHIMAWNDDFYSNIAKEHGEDVAKLVGDSHRTAIDFVEKTVKEENIDCNFSRVDGYLFPHEDSNKVLDTLLKEFEASLMAGFDVKMVDLGKDPACGRIGKAILFPNCGDFHPLMYINGLAKAIVKHGGKIYEQSRVKGNEGPQVTTYDGHTVTADALVLATQSPIHHNLAIHSRQEAQRSYVLGFKIKKGSVKRAQWWDTDIPYHYIRIEQKPGDYDVLIVGGNDTPTGMKSKDLIEADPFTTLEKWTRERWSAAGEVMYKWTGQVYKPIDSLHLIGPDPIQALTSKVYVATGGSGQGMTGGTIAGILLKDLILGNENPWARMYDPRRLPPLDTSVAMGTAEVVGHTVQGYANAAPLLGADFISIESMAPNSGAIKQEGLDKVAVYKDENGEIHKYSAVCPHLKCIVQWNCIDASWDCPCHGSIFDSRGQCVNGPAKADLTPL